MAKQKLRVEKQIKRFVRDQISRQEKLNEKEKMSPLMQAIKAVHSVAAAGDSLSEEDLKRQRAGQDLFSKLATPPIGVSSRPVMVDEIKCEFTGQDLGHDKRHVILYCHGGGYTCGSINYARILASKLSIHTGLSVFSFEYRLAPENPYPAALKDALQVWDYLMMLGYGAKDTVVAGDSAGGNLALELCLGLKKQRRLLPCALVLMSPWTDMTMSGFSYEECLNIDPMLTPDYIRACRRAYAGDADYKSPDLSPIFADLEDFPPTLIQVGTKEILKSDSELLAEKLTGQGVFSKLEIYEDSWHVFQQMPLRRSSKALSQAADFIGRVIYD